VQRHIRAGNLELLQGEGSGPLQTGGEFSVDFFSFGQSFGRDLCAECVHASQSVGDHNVFRGDMSDVRRELGKNVEMVKLPWAALVAPLLKA